MQGHVHCTYVHQDKTQGLTFCLSILARLLKNCLESCFDLRLRVLTISFTFNTLDEYVSGNRTESLLTKQWVFGF